MTIDKQDYLDEVYNFITEYNNNNIGRCVPFWHTYQWWYGRDCSFCQYSMADSKCIYFCDIRYLA